MAKKKVNARSFGRINADKKTGLRTIRKDGRTKSGYSNLGVVGNLIRSDAKVTNILRYLETASTNQVPYLISTYSRYQALVPNKTKILDSAIGSYHTSEESPIIKIANDIADDESKAIIELLSQIWQINNADQLVDRLNKLTVNIKGVRVRISEIVNHTRQAVQDAFFEYKIADKQYAKQVYDAMYIAREDPARFTQTSMAITAHHGSVGYRNLHRDIVGDLLTSIDFLVDTFDKVEIGARGKDTIEKAISSVMIPLLTSSKQAAHGQGASEIETIKYMTKINTLIDKVEADLNKEVGKIGLNKGWFSSGNFAEVLSAGLLMRALKEEMENKEDMKDGIQEHVRNSDEAIADVAVEIVSDQSATMKTVDIVGIINGIKMPIDTKTHSQAKTEKHGGLVYESSMSVNFKVAHQSLMKGNSIPPSALKLYRGYMLNQGINDGYMMTSVKEKSMYVQEYLKTEEGLNYKFKSEELSKDGTGYPYLVQINGKFHRFSTVIKKMQNSDDFFAEMQKGSKGSYKVRGAANISSFGMSPQQLYINKMAAGAAVNSLGKMTGSRTIPGFSQEVKGLAALVNRIEDDYFNDKPTRDVRFTIMLRS